MFDIEYQSDDNCYQFIQETGDFILSTKKYKIRLTLTGIDAKLFKQHLEAITSEPDEKMKKRIERVIGIHMYMYMSSALEEENPKK